MTNLILKDFLFENQLVNVVRLDRINTYTGGNKIFKLIPHLEQAKTEGKNTLLSFGGAYSNHLVALATMGKQHGFNTIGIVRGDELHIHSNASLKHCAEHGMQLEFIERNLYQKLKSDSNQFIADKGWESVYCIPEGGTSKEAVLNCAKIHDYIPANTRSVVCAVGSGGTFCGLACGLKPNQYLFGISASKDYSLKEKTQAIFEKLNIQNKNTQLNFDFAFGGFGKWNEELMVFIQEFGKKYGIGLDPVYTGKMVFGALQLIREKKIAGPISLIHSGGLQAFPELIID